MSETGHEATVSALAGSVGGPTQPLLTILVFSYNRAGFLAGTLSWLTRLLGDGKYPEVECLVSNNLSSDDTEAVALARSTEIPGFRYIRQPTHHFSGDVHVLAGLAEARGRYVWVMSDDDTIDFHLFPEVLGHLRTGELKFLFCNPAIYSVLGDSLSVANGIVKKEDLDIYVEEDLYVSTIKDLVRKLGLLNVMGSYSATIVEREAVLKVNCDEYLKISPVGALVPILIEAFGDSIGGFFLKPAVICTLQPRRLENPEGNVLVAYGHSHGSHSRFFWTTLIARMFKVLVGKGVVTADYFCSIIEVGLYGKYRLAHAVIHWCCEQLHEWLDKRTYDERFGSELITEVRSLYDGDIHNFRYQWAFSELYKSARLIDESLSFYRMPPGVYEIDSWVMGYLRASTVEESANIYEHIRGIIFRKTQEIKTIIAWDQGWSVDLCESMGGYHFCKFSEYFYALSEIAKGVSINVLDGREAPPHILASHSLAELRERVRGTLGLRSIVVSGQHYGVEWKRGRYVGVGVTSGYLVREAERDRDWHPYVVTAVTLDDLRAKIAAIEFNDSLATRSAAPPEFAGDRMAAMEPLFDGQHYRRAGSWSQTPIASGRGSADAPAPNGRFGAGGLAPTAGPAVGDLLADYLENGRQAGLQPHPLFDEAWYLATYPAVQEQIAQGLWRCAFEHFCAVGTSIGLSPSPFFDEGWVRARYMGEAALRDQSMDVSGFRWFVTALRGRGIAPNPYFDEAWYLEHHPQAAAEFAQDPRTPTFVHYVLSGQTRGYSPGPEFIETFYREQHTDVAEAVDRGLYSSGYHHYAAFGRFEGRRCSDQEAPPSRRDAYQGGFPIGGAAASTAVSGNPSLSAPLGGQGADRLSIAALADVKSARRAFWKPARRFIAEADAARSRGEWAEAADLYKQALEQNPDRADIWVQYGHALKETGNAGDAETAYRIAISKNDQEPDFHLQLGHLLKVTNRGPEAQLAYRRALSLDPNLAAARQELLGAGYLVSEIEAKIESPL